MSIIEDLLKLNIEFEGALRVVQNRKSDEAIEIAKDRLDKINLLFVQVKSQQSEPITTTTAEPVAPAEEKEQNPEPPTNKPETAKAKTELRKAFTLNDKFLFRREIFNGNEQEFNDTINLIESMSSLSEAQEYLFEDLQLDRENDAVNEFMGIITNYFVNR